MLKTVCSVVVLAFVASLVGCGDTEVKKEDVEKTAGEQLAANNPGHTFPITCPGNLKGKVGTTLTCSTTVDGKTHPVDIKVTSVDGTNIKFDINIGDAK
jgi:hypothetical protein